MPRAWRELFSLGQCLSSLFQTPALSNLTKAWFCPEEGEWAVRACPGERMLRPTAEMAGEEGSSERG